MLLCITEVREFCSGSTGGPRYSRSFYLRFRLFEVQKLPFFKEPILQFQPYIGLFIREFVIRGPIFQERIYRE